MLTLLDFVFKGRKY